MENSQGTLQSLLATVQDQAARQADFVINTRDLNFATDDEANSRVIIEASKGEPTREFRVNDVAFDQIAERAGMDRRFARRLKADYPDVLDHAVRRIWDQESQPRMVRTFLDGQGECTGEHRAFLSNRFKTFDNHHLLEATLPTLMEDRAAGWEVVRGSTVTDRRMYLRLKSRYITADRQRSVGDVMALGISISNSEVGMGSIMLKQLVWTLACLNGMVTNKSLRQSHLTGARDLGDDIYAMLTDETKALDNAALAAKTKDVLIGMSQREELEKQVELFRRAADQTINGSGPEAVETLGGILNLTKGQTSSVLDGLMSTIQQDGYRGHPISKATLVNAVTAVQHKVEADEVDDWQEMGAKVLNLPAEQWARVAAAA